MLVWIYVKGGKWRLDLEGGSLEVKYMIGNVRTNFWWGNFNFN